MLKFAETLVHLVYEPPPPQQYIRKHMQHLHMKSEADRCLSFEKLPVAFIEKNNPVALGFYYTDHRDVVCCAFCVAHVALW